MIKLANDVRADLHSHTTASDGVLLPAELVREAAARGLTHIAISDHDTLAGIAPAQQAAHDHGIDVIPAIEVTCRSGEQEIHVLGLCIDANSADLIAFAGMVRRARYERYVAMVERLRDVCGLADLTVEAAVPVKEGSLGRPELARMLLEMKYVGRLQEAFDMWLGKGKPAFVPNSAPDVSEALAAIHGAGGASILAHCGLYRDGEALAARLLDQGLMGIEVFHPDHSVSRQERLLALARERKALVSGGADFHEHDSPKAKHFGRVYVGRTDLERLFEATN
ncbi:MAG: PHP domain-containing protein [Planctomycetes bacterium]|nr:PHP domain-containing protein [Planctomycetota bacterium]NUQ34942.1 PHP domain-containing protein [Planctomycetaceae bacterium]